MFRQTHTTTWWSEGLYPSVFFLFANYYFTLSERSKTYNENVCGMKPKVDNICDNCQSQLIKRSDDNVEIYNIRYNNYLEKTVPLIDYYQQKKILYTVDGNQSSDYTYIQINEILNNYL